MILPDEIHKKTFPVSFRGYNQEEVNSFLEQLSQEITALNEEIKLLRKKMSALTLENEKYYLEEQSLHDKTEKAEAVLKNAEVVSEETIKNAAAKAEDILSSAKAEGDEILSKASAEAKAGIEKAKEAAEETIAAAKAHCASVIEETEKNSRLIVESASQEASRIKKAAEDHSYSVISEAAEKSNSLVVTAQTEAAKLRSSADYHVAICHQRYLIMSELISKIRVKTDEIINTVLKEIDTLADEFKTNGFSNFLRHEDESCQPPAVSETETGHGRYYENTRYVNTQCDNARRDDAEHDDARRDNAQHEVAQRDDARYENTQRDNAQRDNARYEEAWNDGTQLENAWNDSVRHEVVQRENVPDKDTAVNSVHNEVPDFEMKAEDSLNSTADTVPELISPDDVRDRISRIINSFRNDAYTDMQAEEAAEAEQSQSCGENHICAGTDGISKDSPVKFDDEDFNQVPSPDTSEDIVTAQYDTLPAPTSSGDIDVIYGSFDIDEIMTDDKF